MCQLDLGTYNYSLLTITHICFSSYNWYLIVFAMFTGDVPSPRNYSKSSEMLTLDKSTSTYGHW